MRSSWGDDSLLPRDYFEPEPDLDGPEAVEAFVKAVHREPTEAQLKGWGIARGVGHGTVPSIHSRDLAGLADAQGPADHRRGGPDRGDHAPVRRTQRLSGVHQARGADTLPVPAGRRDDRDPREHKYLRGPVGAADRYPAPQRRPRRIWRALGWLVHPNVVICAVLLVALLLLLNAMWRP